MIELQECAICMEIQSQIYRCQECKNEHCYGCHRHILKCPYCRKRFPSASEIINSHERRQYENMIYPPEDTFPTVNRTEVYRINSIIKSYIDMYNITPDVHKHTIAKWLCDYISGNVSLLATSNRRRYDIAIAISEMINNGYSDGMTTIIEFF